MSHAPILTRIAFIILIASAATPAHAGYPDGLNTYAGYHVMYGGVDPLGLSKLNRHPGKPAVFWDEWTQADRNKWYEDFKKRYSAMIKQSAKTNCVPAELIAAILANEMIDYSGFEEFFENRNIGGSFGLGQITPGTIIREGVLTDEEISRINNSRFNPNTPPSTRLTTGLRNRLVDDHQFSVEMAARLIGKYLEEMCKAAKEGGMSDSFNSDKDMWWGGCDVKDYCCKTNNKCEVAANYDVPPCLIERMAAQYNFGRPSGKYLWQYDQLGKRTPQSLLHGRNAQHLDGIFEDLITKQH